MEIKIKYLAVGVVALLLAGLAIGRFTLPAEIITKTEIQTVEVEKVVEKFVKDETSKENVNKKQQIHIVETTFPDGTYKKETFIINEDTVVIEKWKTESNDKIVEKEKESKIIKEKQKLMAVGNWRASVVAGVPVGEVMDAKFKDVLMYGGVIERRVAGPFFAGAFGTSTKEFGLSVGMEF